MTLFLVDCSKYQVERPNPLSLTSALQAGFGIVNIALDRGKAADVLSGWARDYADEARSLGMGISTYRWLDGRISGVESANRAYARMLELGGPSGMAHIVDCEDTATEQIVRDYLITMQALLGRPVGLYTGDWWWTAQGRNWPMAGLSPYLHAAPNAGYLPAYPGDVSTSWSAGYGGWPNLSIMQYAVAPLPGTGNCSLSAIRDPAVWTALTGGSSVGAYEEWVAAGKPVSGIVRPLARVGQRLRVYGYTVYNIGDQSHLTHLPPEDHTPFSGTGWPISSPRWWIHAGDVMPPPAGSGLPSLAQLSSQMLSDARTGHPGMAWLKYMNHEPDGPGGSCYQDRFMPSYERRSSTDRGHIHLSARSDVTDSAAADSYDPVARVRGVVTTGSRDVMFIAQFKNPDGSINTSQWIGDGVFYRTVTWYESVTLYLDKNAVRVGPFKDMPAMLDVIGKTEAKAQAADPGLAALTAIVNGLSDRLSALAGQVQALADRPAPEVSLELSEEQIAALVEAVRSGAALSESDQKLILALVKQAAREGTGPLEPASA